MTDPVLRDPAENLRHYRECTGYEDNKDRFNEPRVKWIGARLPKTGSLLDIGGNDGFITELLAPEVDYLGVELNVKAVENAYPRAKGKLLQVDVMTADFGRPFDTVLCAEVLEHVLNPLQLLLRLKGLLKPQGRLITTSAQGRGESWEPENKEHLREWNPAEYYRLHEQAGFLVMEQAVVRVYGERYTNAILAVPGGGG